MKCDVQFNVLRDSYVKLQILKQHFLYCLTSSSYGVLVIITNRKLLLLLRLYLIYHDRSLIWPFRLFYKVEYCTWLYILLIYIAQNQTSKSNETYLIFISMYWSLWSASNLLVFDLKRNPCVYCHRNKEYARFDLISCKITKQNLFSCNVVGADSFTGNLL